MPESQTRPISLLVIDDDPQMLDLVSAALQQEGLEIHTSSSPEEGLEMFRRLRPEIVLLDLVMPKLSGMEVLKRIVAIDPGTNVVLTTAQYSTDSAVEAIQLGACDYLPKPIDIRRLRARVATLIEDVVKRQQIYRLDQELVDVFQFEGIIGRSPLMLEVFAKIERVAPHFRTALISGPTGTGKELVVRALQRRSPYSSAPFAVCDCSAIVETLFESELFGYVKGAFTGAAQDKVGIIEYANGGIVFLDEIGEMPLSAQAKLLRVLQNHEVRRVGSPLTRKVDVRVIAATNRDLHALVSENRFRADLYYRLSMVEIKLPRLADRREDIPLLQRHFVRMFSEQYGKPIYGLTRRAQTLLARYPWPGNVRELENVLGNACMMADETMIDVQDLPYQLREYMDGVEAGPPKALSFEELQYQHIQDVLEQVGGDKARAAKILGIGRATLYKRLAEMKEKHNAAKAATNSTVHN